MSKLISIIIPTYNRSSFLRIAIESALKQSYKNIEIVVSDNCSTDDTAQMMEQYRDESRVKYFKNETNLGMVGNWRKALYEYISGEWAIILSDDDYFVDDTYIQSVVELLQEDSELVLVHANQLEYIEDKEETLTLEREFPRIMNGKDLFVNYHQNNLVFFLATTCFHVEKMRAIDVFQTEINSVDWLEFLKLSLYGKVGFIKSNVAVYRRHSQSISVASDLNRLLKNIDYILLAYQHALENGLVDTKLLESWKKRMISRYIYMLLVGALQAKDYKSVRSLWHYVSENYPFALRSFFAPKMVVHFVRSIIGRG